MDKNNTEAPLTLLLTYCGLCPQFHRFLFWNLCYPRSKERGFTVRKRVVALPWDVKSALADISALHPRTKVQGFAPIFHNNHAFPHGGTKLAFK